MAQFKLTDRFENTIKSVIEGEDIKGFPLLSRMTVLETDVLQTYKVVDGEATDYKTQVLGDGAKYDGEITFINNGDITESAVQRAVQKITMDIYSQMEKDILTEALATTGDYVQGFNDFLFMKDNDLVPRSVPQFETNHMDDLLLEEVLINPSTGIIVGQTVPQFEIVMDMSTNEVKVYGFLVALHSFTGEGVIKVIKGENKPKPILVESIELSQKTASMDEGTTKQITATVKPDNADDKTVTWTSSSDATATVDANGLITAVKAGTATITAKAGDKTATVTVTVKAVTPPVEG